MKKLVLLVALALVLSVAPHAFAIDQTVIAEQGNFRLVRIEYSNKNVLAYSVTSKVTEETLWAFNSPGHKKAEQPLLARNLFNVSGVTAVQFMPYQMRIEIAPAFDREQMKAKVEQAILDRYGIKR